jgi:hypothetical protein
MQGEEFLSPSAIPALRAFFGERHEGVVIPDPAGEPMERLVLSAFIRPDFFSKLSAPGPLTAVRREMVLEKRQWRAGRLGGFFWGRAGEDDPAPLAATEAVKSAIFDAVEALTTGDRVPFSRPTQTRSVVFTGRISGAVGAGIDLASGADLDAIAEPFGLSRNDADGAMLADAPLRDLVTRTAGARAVVSWMIARGRRARAG